MYKDLLRQFLSLFDCLEIAASAVLGDYNNEDQESKQALEAIDKAYERISNTTEIRSWIFKLIDELELYLGQCPKSNHNNIVTNLIREFNQVAPYLDADEESQIEEGAEFGFGRNYTIYSIRHKAASQLIREEENRNILQPGTVNIPAELSIAEGYILECHYLLGYFAKSLDAICLGFDIDIDDAQNELAIFIFRRRDLTDLYFDGYKDKLKNIKGGPEILSTFDLNHVETEKHIYIQIKPRLNPEFIPEVFIPLKNYFSREHQELFRQILLRGIDSPEPLIFLDNGNRLAYSFKLLYEAGLITGCNKKELEGWIARNFRYRSKDVIKSFKPRYLNDIISTNNLPCKNPVFDLIGNKYQGKLTIR